MASVLQHIALGYKHINAIYAFLTCAANVSDTLLHTPPAISFLQPLCHVGKAMEVGMNAIVRPMRGRNMISVGYTQTVSTKRKHPLHFQDCVG